MEPLLPADLLQLTTAFSGAQLIAFAYVITELRRLSDAQKEHAKKSDAKAEKIADLSEQVSRIVGQLEGKGIK